MNAFSLPSPLLTIFGLAMLFLGLKALILGSATAATRGRIKQFINPEDAAWLQGNHVEHDSEMVARIGRAHRNDLENLLVFAIAGVIYLAADASKIAGAIYCGLFVIARLLHTFAYLSKRPLLRRYAYTLGFFVITLMSIHAAVALIIN